MPKRNPQTPLEAWRLARAHIHAETPAFTGTWTPLFKTPAWKESQEALNSAMLAHDLSAAKVACRTSWTLAITYAKEGRLP